MTIYVENEQTILGEEKFGFRAEVMLQDCEYIFDKKYTYGEPEAFVFTAAISDYSGIRDIKDLVERAITEIEWCSDPYTKKKPKQLVFDKYDALVFNQLRPPTVNGENLDPHSLRDRRALIKGNLREDRIGRIFANAQFVDVLPLDQQPGTASTHTDLDDF